MKREFSGHIFEKYSITKFHDNPSSGSHVVPCGRTDRQKDMMKLIVAFCNFAMAPQIRSRMASQQVTRTLRVKVSRLLFVEGNV
jgi:hypothetical protein